MKQKILRTAAALALTAVLVLPARAARMLVPVGRVVGLSVAEGTVTVAAFDETLGAAAQAAGMEIGDEIVAVDGAPIDTAADLQQALRASDGTVELELRRKDRRYRLKVAPQLTGDGPKLGVFLREGVTGIGTVTYFDPGTGEFGALGHGVSDSHGKICVMDSGAVYRATVLGVRRGEPGSPGQLRGMVTDPAMLAALEKNTACGVFGQGGAWQGEALPVAEPDEVQVGEAQILSNIDGERVQSFSVAIRRRNLSPQSHGRDLLLEVTDPKLLQATGGIVAGMSGSPILQNGRLVGAVTHVCVRP